MHQHLQADWRAPQTPERYPELTAYKILLDSGFTWRMDFSRADGKIRLFASDAERCPLFAWPWEPGFDPQEADWRAIGFVHVFEFRHRAPPEPSQADLEFIQTVAKALASDNGQVH